MSWADRRRTSIAVGIVLFFVTLTVLGWYAFIYTPATCTDGIQNQDELGIDCDGSCARICTVPRVDALFSRAVNTAPGVYHAVALVKNPLPNARARGVSYALSLFDAENILVAERRGTLQLEPGETRVLFESNVLTGERIPARTLTRFEGGEWDRALPDEAVIRVIPGTLDTEKRILTSVIENLTPISVTGIIMNALLYDSAGVLVTASETRLESLQAFGRHEATFTWLTPFERSVTTWDIVVRHEPPQAE